MTIEYLATPRTPTRLPRRAIIAVVVAVVLVAGLFVWWTDAVRREANETLAAALQDTSQGAKAGQARVLSTLAYSYPMIWSTSVPYGLRTGLREVVESSAGEVAADLRRVRADVAAVRVLPWQADQQVAQREVLALIDAHLARFDRMSADAASIGPVMSETDPSDASARESLRASGAGEPPKR